MTTKGTPRPAVRIRLAEARTVTPREKLEGKTQGVSQNHEGIDALSLALDELEFRYVQFSTEAVQNCVRAAIVDALRAICKFQGKDIKELLSAVNELDPPPAAEK